MPRITLPDGSTRDFDQPISAADVAADIGPGLLKAAIGARVNGELCDLSTTMTEDSELALITARNRDGSSEPDALHLIRHSCAHIMAEAIQRVLPEAKLVYGPPTDTGFYYDISFEGGRSLSSSDFESIEAEMAKIIAEDRPFTRYEMSCEEGLAKLESEGSKYKIDNAQRAIEGGSETLSWYATGVPNDDWEDLCKGPHVPSTGRVAAFKLMSLASSYWHGDADSDRLTRVYGTAFGHKKQLKKHLNQLEEARKRDHRKIGTDMRLYLIDEMVGQGLVLWSPRGATIRRELEEFIRRELVKQGYETVYTPHIGKLDLYKTSGHFPYYQDSQYPPMIPKEDLDKLAEEGGTCADLSNDMRTGEIDGYLLKPMNCPHHMRIFRSERHSYRDLPVRLAEFGTVYRWEQSGELGGMTRVRGFTQDDAHLFCMEEQVAEELVGCLDLVKTIFKTLDIEEYRVRVGLRDPDSEKYVGDTEVWDKAEEACRAAARSLGVPFTEEAGEAAFYGPKIDFVVKDVVGREWQLGTVQVDYSLPVRFDLSYIGPDNNKHRPVVIHRAPFGSMERFCAVLIEHFAGNFPTWLAPEQVRVMPISEKSLDYGKKVLKALRSAGMRATMDSSDERVQAKIRNGAKEKIPYLLVVGPRDAEESKVSVRARGINKNLGAMDLDAFIEILVKERDQRSSKSLIVEHMST
jgi:threonyl-tRNA synthetase